MDRKVPYVNIEGLEDCLNNGVSIGNRISILAGQFRETSPRLLRDERLGQFQSKREFCIECPIIQDQPKTLWIFPFAETMGDVIIGDIYAEMRSLENYAPNGADYLRLQIHLKKARKLQGGMTEPKNRTVDMHIIDWRDKTKGITVRRDDYIQGLLFSKNTEILDIETSIVIPEGKLQPQQRY